jgi:nucleotide-binding universal stress UspA family protein
MRPEQVDQARIQLSRRILGDSRSRVTITSDVILGPADMMIPAYAGDSGFDLIVMGTRGRGGLAHLLMGSIAESVIRTARCPVVTVKSAQVRQRPAADIGATPVAV